MARSNTGSTSNYMTNAVAALTATPLTIAGWFFPANLTNSFCVAGLTNNTGSNYYSLIFDGANELGNLDNSVGYDLSGSAAGGWSTTTTVASANTWNHACGVSSSDAAHAVYLNGGGKNTSTTSRPPSSWVRTTVGAFRTNNTTFNPLNGSIAEVGIWNVALSDAEVLMLAKGFAPPLVRPDALVAYWPLLGRMASPEQDRWGNFHLTLTGTMAQAAHVPVFYRSGWEPGIPVAAGGGGANPSPVAATVSVVAAALALVSSPDPVAAPASVVGAVTQLLLDFAPVAMSAGVPAVVPVNNAEPAAVAVPATPVSMASSLTAFPSAVPVVSAVKVATQERVETPAAVVVAAAVAQPAASLAQDASSVTAVFSAPAPQLSALFSAASVSALSSVVQPDSSLDLSVSPVVMVGTVPPPTVSGAPITEFPNAVGVSAGVASPTTSLVGSVAPTTTTVAVVTPTSQLQALVDAATSALASSAFSASLVQDPAAIVLGGTQPVPVLQLDHGASPVSTQASFSSLASSLVGTVTPVVLLASVPVVTVVAAAAVPSAVYEFVLMVRLSHEFDGSVALSEEF